MNITVHCTCGKSFEVRDIFAGRMAMCGVCGKRLKIPEHRSIAPTLATADLDSLEELESTGTPLPSQPSPYVSLHSPSPARPDPADEKRAPCPNCQQMILARAMKCEYCGTSFHVGIGAPRPRYKPPHIGGWAAIEGNVTFLEWLIIIFLTPVALVMGLYRALSYRDTFLLKATCAFLLAYWGLLAIVFLTMYLRNQ